MAFNSVFGGGGMGGMGGRGGGGGREEEEGNNLQRRVEELEARLQLLEFVGGAAGYVVKVVGRARDVCATQLRQSSTTHPPTSSAAAWRCWGRCSRHCA